MKRTMKKMVSMALTGTMAVAVLAGAGTSEVKAADKAKIGAAVFPEHYTGYLLNDLAELLPCVS